MSESKLPKGAPGGGPSKKKEFIRETIEEKQPSKRSRVQKGILLLALAVVFGLIAACTFVLSEPWFRTLFAGETESRESVQIPRDDKTEENTTPAQETPEASTEDCEVDEEALKESVEALVRGYLATWDSGEEGEPIYTELVSRMSDSLRRSMVTVTSRQADEDVFKQQYVRSQEAFGMIFTVTKQEMLILTTTDLLEETESVRVTLGNKDEYNAGLVSMDKTTGLAVISIPLGVVDEETQAYVEPVTLGNSYICQAGDTVVALGSPMGYVPSVSWGIISYINGLQQGTDMNFQLIQTDIAGSSQGAGILVNLDGEVIGWITQKYNSDENKKMLAAISISDIKGYIERLSNGETMARLGVKVQVVAASIADEKQLPTGLYISQCVSGSPAYEAGLQNGDILVKIDGSKIENLSDLQNLLMARDPGDVVSVTVMRSGRNGYAEQVFQVKLEER